MIRLPPASILGIGAVTPIGREIAAIATALAKAPPTTSPRCVPEELLSDAALARRMRRADRWTRLATIAAQDCFTAANHASDGAVGVIVATGMGPHVRTFRFLDGILDCGDAGALPTDFSHSVHTCAVAYITELLGLRGRSCTLADFEAGFHQAVLLAQCWLAEGACQRVLVGAVDELGEALLHLAARMLAPGIVPGEGSAFFMLGPANASGTWQIDASSEPVDAATQIIDDLHLQAAKPTFILHFGTSASTLAMQTLGAVLTGTVDRTAIRRTLRSGQTVTLTLTEARP